MTVLEKNSWKSKEYSFLFSCFLSQVPTYNLPSDKATSQENLQVRSHMQLAAVEDYNFLFFFFLIIAVEVLRRLCHYLKKNRNLKLAGKQFSIYFDYFSFPTCSHKKGFQPLWYPGQNRATNCALAVFGDRLLFGNSLLPETWCYGLQEANKGRHTKER